MAYVQGIYIYIYIYINAHIQKHMCQYVYTAHIKGPRPFLLGVSGDTYPVPPSIVLATFFCQKYTPAGLYWGIRVLLQGTGIPN